MKTHLHIASLSLVVACGISSCRTFYPDTGAGNAETLPSGYSAATPAGPAVTNEWWTGFNSEEINTLMRRALKDNLTVAQAGARLRQASAAARKAGAAKTPEFMAAANAGVSQRSAGTGPDQGDGSTGSYDIGLAASYELDLWGRVRAGTRSAGLGAEASRRDLESATMTLAAQVADRWLQLIEARAQVSLLDQQLETNRQLLSLLKNRIGKSTTRLLDVYQQEQAVLLLEAARPLAEQRVELLLNELALLAGTSPGTDLGLQQASLPGLPDAPAAGIPADLIVNRPDIRAELSHLQAAGWDMAAARADRFPALRLTARAGYAGDSVANLFDDWLANLAAGLTAPLLDGGRRRAEVDRTRARLDEQLARYRLVILEAVRDVEDALVRERRLQERAQALDGHLAGSRLVLDEARHRYLKGADTYLTVLIALRAVQQGERDTLTARRELLSNRVALRRALGGSWASAGADAATTADGQRRENRK